MALLLGGAISPKELMEKREGALLALSAAVLSFGGQCLVNKGLQHCKAGPAVVISTLDVPLSYIYGLFILGESLSLTSVFSSSLVFFAAVLIGVRQAVQTQS